MRARLHEGGCDPDGLLRDQSRQVNEHWDSQGYPLVLHPDPQRICQDSSLQGATPTNFRAAARAPVSVVYELHLKASTYYTISQGSPLSWVPLLCAPYERGRGNRAEPRKIIHFNRLVGGVLSEGVSLADLSEKHSLPDLVNRDGPGLPDDVAAKISIRIEVWTRIFRCHRCRLTEYGHSSRAACHTLDKSCPAGQQARVNLSL